MKLYIYKWNNDTFIGSNKGYMVKYEEKQRFIDAIS